MLRKVFGMVKGQRFACQYGRCSDRSSDSGGWVVASRMFLQNGVPVIGELRLFRTVPDREAGCWSADYLGTRAQVPNGGITAKIAVSKLANTDLEQRTF